MIQSAASSITSSLALGVGTQAVPGDDATVSADFAALLESTLGSGQVGMTDQAPVLDPATNPLIRQESGNAAGKKLPLDLLLADAALAEAAQTADDTTSDTDAVAPLTTVTTDIILPGLVVPLSVPAPGAPKAAAAPSSATRSTMESLAQTAAAQAIRPKLPEAAGTDAKAAPLLPGSDSATTTKPVVQTVQFQLPSQSAETANAAAPATAPASIADNAAVTLTAATPASAQAAVSIAIPLPRTRGQAASARNAEALPTPSVDAKAARTETSDPQHAAASQPTAVVSSLMRDAEAASARMSAAAKLAADTPAAAAPSSAAPVAQPMIGMDAQSFAQTVAPVTTSPATGSIAQTGHDFAALVDRLVEARQFAAPEAVHAAITHSDFGQVSLRFDQDANGLSVSMTSADPEFANAVQATAASSQSQTTSDNGSNPSRQDGQSQQQTAGSASGQSQSQSQSQASARNERNAQAETRFGRGSSQQTQADEPADTRGGIYA